MRLLNFLIFSSIEFAAIFILILILFRFQLRGYVIHVAFASLVLAQASFLFNDTLHWEAIAPLLQVIIYFLFLSLMFRVHKFYSAIMALMGYLVYSLIQLLTLFIIEWLKIFTLEEAIRIKSLGYTLQIVTSIVTVIICWILNRYRIGFSFVPDSERERVSLKGVNIRFLIVMFFATVVIAACYVFLLGTVTHMIIAVIFMVIALGLLFYLSVKKEVSE